MSTEIAKNHLLQIEDFIIQLFKFSDSQSDYSSFSSLVRSSFIKYYEFLKLVYPGVARTNQHWGGVVNFLGVEIKC
jgi:hypothetical protein